MNAAQCKGFFAMLSMTLLLSSTLSARTNHFMGDIPVVSGGISPPRQEYTLSIKIVRPESAEKLSMVVGFTFVSGTVSPTNATVFCNDQKCDVSDDGAFIGFVPIRLLKGDFVEAEGKTCDAQFDFVVQGPDGDGLKKSVPVITPRGPGAAVAVQQIFDPPKILRAKQEVWLGLENSDLGKIIFLPKGTLLPSKTGGGASYAVDFGSLEVNISTNEVQVTSMNSNLVAKAYLVDPRSENRIEIVNLANASEKHVMEGFAPWGMDFAVKPQLSFSKKTAPSNADKNSFTNSPLKGLRVCLDPGHNPDSGAVGPRGLEERHSTLMITYEAKKLLKQKGATVSLTHETKGLVLRERHERMDELNPDLLISIHNNSVPDGQDPRASHGTQTFYLHPWSKPLAEAVHQAMLKNLETKDLKCIRRNLYITRYPKCPSILIEPEYIILPDIEKKFLTPEYRQKIAQSIVEGVEEFMKMRTEGKRD
jgi:N-acetylmuramoyl-L-alanine amidase